MKILELYCGTKSFSNVGKEMNNEVFTIDNNPKFKPDLCIDILKLKKTSFPILKYDVVLASPPCTEFSKSNMPDSWNKNRSVLPDTRLLQKTIKIIYWIKPKYWVIENVTGARPFFYLFLGEYKKKVGSRYLWGDFPIFDCKNVYGKWKLPPGDDRPALRSLIPYDLSLALCKSIEG